MNTSIFESFKWLEGINSFKVKDTGQKTIRIKGVAARAGDVSKNGRKYMGEELKKSVSSMVGKWVTVNHDDSKRVGKILDADWEDEQLEYLAEIWAEPYVALIRNKSATIRGVSIQAQYRNLECAICGKKFESQAAWREHMETDEFVKDGLEAPHGIVFEENALSLVLAPETPGLNTTMAIYEMQQGFHRLCETVFKNKIKDSQLLDKLIVTNNKLKEEHQKTKTSRIAVTQEQPHVAVGRGKNVNTNLTEQNAEPTADASTEEPEKDEHGCIVGKETWDGEKCVPKQPPETTEQEQGEADHDAVSHECPEGEHWDESRQQCVLDIVTTEQEHDCPEGEHWSDEQNKCVPDEPVAEPTSETRKTPLLQEKIGAFKIEEKAPKLSLGEPFAGYTDFADCVAKNQDKENPEAYCGQIKHEVEGEMWFRTQTTSKLNEVISKLNSAEVTVPVPSTRWVGYVKQNLAKANANQARIKALRETVRKLPKDDVSWKQIKPYDDAELREAIANMKPFDDSALKQEIQGLKETSDNNAEVAAKQYGELKELITKKDEDITLLRQAVEIYDKNAAAKTKVLETRQKSIEEIAKRAEEAEKETKTLKEQLEQATVRADNLEDKLSKHSDFKGNAKPLDEKAGNPDLTYTPDKDKERKRK